jgi:protein-tyrosine kinase
MERIREAIRLAKSRREAGVSLRTANREAVRGLNAMSETERRAPAQTPFRTEHVDLQAIEANRLIAHQSENPFSGPYDILRTKIAQAMDRNGWKTLVVTSPTAGCGKTVTAMNLALSFARLPNRTTVLVDLDFRRPSIANNLRLKKGPDLATYLSGKCTLEEAMVHLDISNPQLAVMCNFQPVRNPAEVIGSPLMASFFNYIKTLGENTIVIVDVPPLLISDDVLSFLPLADCCIMAIAERVTRSSEIEKSEDLLSRTNFLGSVLNKSEEKVHNYYYS